MANVSVVPRSNVQFQGMTGNLSHLSLQLMDLHYSVGSCFSVNSLHDCYCAIFHCSPGKRQACDDGDSVNYTSSGKQAPHSKRLKIRHTAGKFSQIGVY